MPWRKNTPADGQRRKSFALILNGLHPTIETSLRLVHLAFEAVGYATAILLFLVRRRSGGDVVDASTRHRLMIAAGAGAMLGSRLLAALCDPSASWRGLASGHIVFGKTIVGSLLGGLIAVEWVKAKSGIRVATGDPLVLPLAVGVAIGRLGCFFAGSIDDTAGLPSSSPLAIRGLDGVSRYPVAIYEIIFVLFVLLPLAHTARRRGLTGDAFKTFLSGYLFFRFFCDFLKPLPPRLYGGLSAIQLACVAGLAHYVYLFSLRVTRSEATD